jgi:hypothetical protein
MARPFSPFCHLRFVALLGLLGLLAVAWGGPRVASAQTPTTTIQNGNADTRLELNYDGGLYVPGTFALAAPADSIPAEGAGTRLMWYPAKAAFRAGRVGASLDGTQWDAANVGDHSVAFGVDTKASGGSATATGSGTTASGRRAMATGNATTASGQNAMAVGWGTTASGRSATAMGYFTTASRFRAVAMGNQTTASGSESTAMGKNTIASGNAATVMGDSTIAATDYSLSIGQSNSANTSTDNTLFVAGNGSLYSRSDALVLDQSGNLTISGTLTESSDRRLKTNIEPLGEGTLRKLGQIRPVRYEFIDPSTHPDGPQIGLIAQNVRTAFPSLVTTGANDMLSLSYSKFTAVLLKGLQEQQREIDAQKTQIATLRAENEAIKAQQATLKKRVTALEAQSGGSILAGLSPVSGLLLALMALGGLLGTGLLWRSRPAALS